jgi:hypothetical protein
MIIAPVIEFQGKYYTGEDHLTIYNSVTTEKPEEKSYSYQELFLTDKGELLSPSNALLHAIAEGHHVPARAILLSGTLPQNVRGFKYDIERAQKILDVKNKGHVVDQGKAESYEFNELTAFFHKITPADLREAMSELGNDEKLKKAVPPPVTKARHREK